MLFKGGHANTIAAKVFRKIKGVKYVRERLTTPDNDFLDLDFSTQGFSRIAVLIHGLEGNSSSVYMSGMTKELNQNDWDVVCLNMRGCSGEPNLLYSAYHSGKTDDLSLVVNHIKDRYNSIAIVGFSLGGNIALKYIGENGQQLNPKIKLGVAVSAPCDLEGSAQELKKAKNTIYMKRFLKSMKVKAREKYNQHPGAGLDLHTIENAKNFEDFDNLYTAPAHGFNDAVDYWTQSSSKQFLEHITIPTLLINATNDPFLSASCYPKKEAESSPNLFLEMPKNGGHLGFLSSKAFRGRSWLEERILEFVSAQQPFLAL